MTPIPKLVVVEKSEYSRVVQDPVAHRCARAFLVELCHARRDVVLGVGDLHCLNGAKDLAEKGRDPARSHPAGRAVMQQTVPGQARQCDDDRQRQEDDQCDRQVDAGHDDQRECEVEQVAGHPGQPRREIGHLTHVGAIPADCLPGRDGHGERAGPAQHAGEKVVPEERLRGVAKAPPIPFPADERELAGKLDRDVERDQLPQARSGRPRAREAIEDAFLQQAGYYTAGEVDHDERRVQGEQPGPAENQVPVEGPCGEAAFVGLGHASASSRPVRRRPAKREAGFSASDARAPYSTTRPASIIRMSSAR